MKRSLRLRPRIVSMNDPEPNWYSGNDAKLSHWERAHAMAKHNGGLPPNLLLDMTMRDEVYIRDLETVAPPDEIAMSTLVSALTLPAGELYAARVGGRFKKGQDICDSITGWLLPWAALIKEVAPSDLLLPQTSLLVRPSDVHVEKFKGKDVPVVHPKRIVPVHSAVQFNYFTGHLGNVWGAMDKSTGMVLNAPKGVDIAETPEGRLLGEPFELRLKKPEEPTVMQPISRCLGNGFLGWVSWSELVFVKNPDDLNHFHPSYVAFDIIDAKGRLLVKNEVTWADIRALVSGKIPNSLKALSDALIAELRKLAQKLPAVYL